MAKHKYGGRIAGTPNKITTEIKAILKDILSKELELLPTHLTTLKTKERLEILIKLLPYVLPKELEISEANPLPLIIVPGDDFDNE